MDPLLLCFLFLTLSPFWTPANCTTFSKKKKEALVTKNYNFRFLKRMYKRLFKEESESPSTPTKKANTSQPRLVISSPNKGIYDTVFWNLFKKVHTSNPDDKKRGSIVKIVFHLLECENSPCSIWLCQPAHKLSDAQQRRKVESNLNCSNKN